MTTITFDLKNWADLVTLIICFSGGLFFFYFISYWLKKRYEPKDREQFHVVLPYGNDSLFFYNAINKLKDLDLLGDLKFEKGETNGRITTLYFSANRELDFDEVFLLGFNFKLHSNKYKI